MTNKTLLIISGGAEAVPGIKRAKAMGLHVVVSDYNPDAPGFAYADDRLFASTYDIGETVAAARSYHEQVRPLDGVICMAADVPLTVASVAAELGLPGIPIETARLAADKLAMKRCFVAAGIAVPWFSAVESSTDLREMFEEHNRCLVIKPVDSRGARGVLRLTEGVDLKWAFEHAKSNSPTGRVMVEEYITGPQVSTESVMLNGRGVTPGFIDRNYEYLERFAPYMIENGGQQPSQLSASDRQAVIELAERAALAMGIHNGIAKGDMVLSDEGPKVIEIAARLSGGWMSSDQIPLATGVDIVAAAVHIALGEPVERASLAANTQQGVAIRYFFPPAGRITAIQNREQVEAQPWLYRLGFFAAPGERIEAVTDHTRRAGYVIVTGEDCVAAVARAQQVVNTIVIETE